MGVTIGGHGHGWVCTCLYFQACKGALQKFGPLMKSEKLNDMFQKHLNPEDSLLYPDFLNDLCKILVSNIIPHFSTYNLVSHLSECLQLSVSSLRVFTT